MKGIGYDIKCSDPILPISPERYHNYLDIERDKDRDRKRLGGGGGKKRIYVYLKGKITSVIQSCTSFQWGNSPLSLEFYLSPDHSDLAIFSVFRGQGTSSLESEEWG